MGPSTLNDSQTFEMLGLEIDDIGLIRKSEAGQSLLMWLEAQASVLPYASDGSGMAGNDAGPSPLWREIALEDEEVQLAALLAKHPNEIEGALSLKPYWPPSKEKGYADSLKEENTLLQREIDLLRTRHSALKDASRRVNRTTKALQRSIHALDSKVRTLEERVTELSVEIDTTLETSTSRARALLRDLGQSPSEDLKRPNDAQAIEPVDLNAIQDFLLGTQTQLSGVGGNLHQKLDTLDRAREAGDTTAEDIQRETERLQRALGNFPTEEDALSYNHQLQNICVQLEHDASTSTLGNLVADVEEQDKSGDGVMLGSMDMMEVLKAAWLKDQAAILQQEDEALEEALESLKSIIAPLDALQPSMSRLVNSVQDTQAVMEAFVEEMEDIQLPDNKSENERNVAQGEDDGVENELKRVFTKFKEHRMPNATPLLVLTRDDMLAELRYLYSNLNTSEDTERTNIENLMGKVLQRPLHPSIHYLYGNSPLLTTPPFAQPKDSQALETRAGTMGSELRDLATTLESEVREEFAKSGSTKRLNAFVEEWTT